jgi:pimeloyl-ACP methyl ester carboxylesterase
LDGSVYFEEIGVTGSATSEVRVELLPVPDAAIHFEVRGAGPPLLLHAAPMDARAFESLATELARTSTVVTSDPRGIYRSSVSDRTAPSTPEDRAEDLARLLEHLELGPATVFGSSGGAVSALALAQHHPGLVSTVVAHEPPLIELLGERDSLRAAEETMVAKYAAGDRQRYWEMFLETAGIELPPGMFDMMFGTPPSAQELLDERYGVERMQLPTTAWRPDVDALVDGPARVIPAVGSRSRGQLCDRTTRALAAQLGRDAVEMPGDHTGFVDQPHAFAAEIRRLVGRHDLVA